MQKTLISATALAIASLSSPVMAQESRDNHFDGPYISIVGDYSMQENDANETLIFDTDRDGNYNDTVRTVPPTSADAFSPGFCGGLAVGSRPSDTCTNVDDDFGAYGRIGLDQRYGNFVVGALIEGGKSWASDSVTGFSTTPASYTLTREVEYEAAARLRAGYTPGGGALFYVTGGGAYARLDNSFDTTNGFNSFSDNGKTNGWGWQAGGGAEVMLTDKLSLGIEYLYTSLNDDDFVVAVGPNANTADPRNLTNPFLINGGGTNIVRSDADFDRHAVRLTTSFRF